MNAQDTANYTFVDFNAESQDDLLGNSGTVLGITPFQFNDCVDEFFIRSFGARRRLCLRENSMRYFRLASTWWRYRRVEGFRTMAERSKRAAPLTYTVILKNEKLRPDGFSNRWRIQSTQGISEFGTRWPLRFCVLGALMLTTDWTREIYGVPMNVRILVVDDNATVRNGLRLLLQEHTDWEVCGEAADGIEAIEKYRQLMPDLLVVDVSMPRMNGLDAAREILKLSPNILILLYTSYLTAQLIDVAHKAGIRGAVSKDAMDLVVVGLEALLRGEEYSGPPN